MTNLCQFVERHLDAVVDGEVDASTRVDFDRHLMNCPACRDRMAFARAFREHLQRSVSRPHVPEGLRERASAALDEEARGGSWAVHTSWRATGAVAAAALILFGVGSIMQERGASGALQHAGTLALFEDVVRAHQRSFPSEVRERAAVPEYFRGRVGFKVQPVEFADPQVRFVGARYTHVGGRQAATLRYDVRGRRLTVVAFRPPARADVYGHSVETGEGRRRLRVTHVAGHTVPVFEHDGVMYAVVGDMESEDRVAIAARATLAH